MKVKEKKLKKYKTILRIYRMIIKQMITKMKSIIWLKI